MRRLDVAAGVIFIFTVFYFVDDKEVLKKPEPIFNLKDAEESTKFKEYKKEYLSSLYFAEEGTNVDSIKKVQRNNSALLLLGDESNEFANGALKGEWFERGPFNEAGDIQEIDYDPTSNDLYALSTVGHLFKGNLVNDSWEVLSDQINLNPNFLEHVKIENNTDRIIAAYGEGLDKKMMRYSDDYGQSWIVPKGLYFYDGFGGPKALFEMSDGTIYYFVHTWDLATWSASYELYVSDNQGYTYSKVYVINNSDLGGSNVKVVKYPKVDALFLYDMNNNNRIKIDHVLGVPIIGNEESMIGDSFTANKFNSSGRMNENDTIHYVYSDGNIFTSNNGINWVDEGETKLNSGSAISPWPKGKSFLANPNNNELYTGHFQFYKTTKGNEINWDEQYGYWWTYYDGNDPDRQDKLHVDITGIEYFEKADETPFIIVLNHAGIHVSYDNMQTTSNLGLNGLNCVTLYDHATAADGSIYFGAQDKGTFSNVSNNNINQDQIESVNQTTGDGMRELFFNDGKSYFGFLQNGFMICKSDKNVTGGYHSWELPGNNIPGWITPVENHPDPSAKKCYVAGGNINGGDGSYLIEMEVSFNEDGSNFEWLPKQFNYDFRANSKRGTGIIKALSGCASDYNRLYVALSDGTFFSSEDAGVNWVKNASGLGDGMLPWDIAVSKTNADSIFVCGSGWSGSGVFFSEDGGLTFQPLFEEAISATYYDIALSVDNKFIFAATSEGPQVYDLIAKSWYTLSKTITPEVEFRSVEFIESEQLVRYGTYGRGLWDLKLDNAMITSKKEVVMNMTVYPNPVVNTLKIETKDKFERFEIFDVKGRNVKSFSDKTVNVGLLTPGYYTLKGFTSKGETSSFKFIKR